MELHEYFNNLLNEKKIAIEEISESTKIPKKFLNLLKNGDYANFPPSVYARGYLKELERFFNLETDELISLYKNISFENKVDEEFKYEPLLNINGNRTNFKAIICLILLILLLLFIIIIFFQNKTKENITNKSSLNIKEVPKPVSKIIPKKLPAKKEKIAIIDNKTKALINNISQKIDNISEKLNKNIIEKVTREDNKTYVITLQPLARVWVRINADNKTHKTFFLQSKTINIDAQKFIKIDIGNAANLKIFINNQKYPLNGKKGEVKHILIDLKKFIKNSKPLTN